MQFVVSSYSDSLAPGFSAPGAVFIAKCALNFLLELLMPLAVHTLARRRRTDIRLFKFKDAFGAGFFRCPAWFSTGIGRSESELAMPGVRS